MQLCPRVSVAVILCYVDANSSYLQPWYLVAYNKNQSILPFGMYIARSAQWNLWLYACKVVSCVPLILQEMDIIQAAKDGSLERVDDALKAGVPVDTTDKVC